MIYKSINSLRGITALGSRCPSHPLFVGACPRSGSRRGTGTIRTRRPTACAWRPLRRRRGPGKPRQQPHWNGELWARARGVAGPPAPVSPAECGWGTQREAGTFRNPGARPGAERAPGPAEIPHGAAQPRSRPLTPISRGVGARARARPHRSARAHGGAGSPAAQDETEGMESSSWFENCITEGIPNSSILPIHTILQNVSLLWSPRGGGGSEVHRGLETRQHLREEMSPRCSSDTVSIMVQ